MIKHKYVTVDSDQMEYEDFKGYLAEFAAYKLNQILLLYEHPRVISIESKTWRTEVHPDPTRAYYRYHIKLSVWMDVTESIYTKEEWKKLDEAMRKTMEIFGKDEEEKDEGSSRE